MKKHTEWHAAASNFDVGFDLLVFLVELMEAFPGFFLYCFFFFRIFAQLTSFAYQRRIAPQRSPLAAFKPYFHGQSISFEQLSAGSVEG